MKENMKHWEALRTPPKEAVNKILGGRLKGMSDIKPQWRYQVMTEQFGVCGIGWKYTIEKLWSEPGPDEQIFAHALVSVQIKSGDEWSDPIPGIGGNMLVEKESRGLHASDEGYKMAVTDALSVAMKMLGVGADIYMGGRIDTKYSGKAPLIDEKQVAELAGLIEDTGTEMSKFLAHYHISSLYDMRVTDYGQAVSLLKSKGAK